ncbi:MAG: hypothetical protein GDA49_03890 [Rhodospirillales bacterium]|nr:hypothetical protein [Rhodospirillales bacterium]
MLAEDFRDTFVSDTFGDLTLDLFAGALTPAMYREVVGDNPIGAFYPGYKHFIDLDLDASQAA